MYFDALTLAAVVDELRATLVGGRVQRVLLPGELSVALEIYAGRRYYLVLSAHPQFARVHFSPVRISRGTDATPPLLLLLRKYVNRGRITAIEQPDLERVLLLSIAKRPLLRNSDDESELDSDDKDRPDNIPPEDETLRCELIVEIMERRSISCWWATIT